MAIIERRTRSDGTASFRTKIRLKGHPPVSATFSRITDARRWGQQTETAILQGRYFKSAEAKKHTLADLINRYIDGVLPNKPRSEKKQRAQLLWWRKQLGAYLLCDVTPPLIAEYRDKLSAEVTRLGKKRSTSTVTRYLAALSHAFSVAERDWHWIEGNPVMRISKPKQPKGRERFLSDHERLRLLTRCRESKEPRLYPIVVLALSTGMRYSEILNLRRDHVDLKNGRVLVSNSKNGDSRCVPLVGHAKAELDRHLKETQGEFLVFSKPGKKEFVPSARIRNAWNDVLREADIKDFRFHDLRHTAATYLAMNGATLPDLAAILGHRTFQMVRRYTHLTGLHTTAVVEKMSSAVFGGSVAA